MRLGRSSLVLIAVFAFGLPGSAVGAVVVGSNFSQAPNATICSQPGLDCTTTLTGLAPARQESGGVSPSSSGVITSWRVSSGGSLINHPVRLRVIRNHMGAGSGPLEIIPSFAGIYEYEARLPVQANDRIGVDTLGPPEPKGVPIIRSPATGAGVNFWAGALADGETRNPTATSDAIELLINATIEPDADGDGFGDETQDGCPSSPTTQGSCPATGGGGTTTTPPPPLVTAPETLIGKRPTGTIHTRRATFRFNSSAAGSTFQCKLDRKPFRSCGSPKTYKRLGVGRHTFRARAIGPTGLVDPTPAKRSFKVSP